MASPFPGMDPYLESPALWPQFHRQFVATLLEVALAGLTERYRAEIGQRRHVMDATDFPTMGDQVCEEPFLEIRQRTDNRLITLVDIVSPANKSTITGRQAYLDTRKEAKGANANVAEIDLITQGQPTLDYSREGLQDWDHAVTITRSTQPERYEIYTATLQKKLPKFRLPLAGDDRDIVVDLQEVFKRVYDQAGIAAQIGYRNGPPVPVRQEDALWVKNLLGLQELPRVATPRKPLTHEAVEAVAYELWERDGRPQGNDQHYWFAALAQLMNTT